MLICCNGSTGGGGEGDFSGNLGESGEDEDVLFVVDLSVSSVSVEVISVEIIELSIVSSFSSFLSELVWFSPASGLSWMLLFSFEA